MQTNKNNDTQLGHERFGAYRYSIKFVGQAMQIIKSIPRGYGELVDQLRRSSLSIPLNIAEGSGRISDAEKRRYYTIARGSSLECSAIIDICASLGFIDIDTTDNAKKSLVHIVKILSSLCL